MVSAEHILVNERKYATVAHDLDMVILRRTDGWFTPPTLNPTDTHEAGLVPQEFA